MTAVDSRQFVSQLQLWYNLIIDFLVVLLSKQQLEFMVEKHGGKLATIQMWNCGIGVDNRWDFPYSHLLSKIYRAHIKVEYDNSIKSIMYIRKYVNKSRDMAILALQQERRGRNAANYMTEIKMYPSRRYRSNNEAVLLYCFPYVNEFHLLLTQQYTYKIDNKIISQLQMCKK